MKREYYKKKCVSSVCQFKIRLWLIRHFLFLCWLNHHDTLQKTIIYLMIQSSSIPKQIILRLNPKNITCTFLGQILRPLLLAFKNKYRNKFHILTGFITSNLLRIVTSPWKRNKYNPQHQEVFHQIRMESLEYLEKEQSISESWVMHSKLWRNQSATEDTGLLACFWQQKATSRS